jgi:hypothetical protein
MLRTATTKKGNGARRGGGPDFDPAIYRPCGAGSAAIVHHLLMRHLDLAEPV